MSTLLIPGPGGAEPEKTGQEQVQGNNNNNGGGGENAGARQQRHSKKPGVPSVSECLLAMAQVAGLVAMGLLKPAQGNTILAAYREILAFHRSKAKETEKSLSNSDVMDLLRKDPKLLDLLAPLLTSEQLEMVMDADNEGADGKA